MWSDIWDKREKAMDGMNHIPEKIKDKMIEQLLQAEEIILKQHNFHQEFDVHGSTFGIRQIHCRECSWTWKKPWWKFWP